MTLLRRNFMAVCLLSAVSAAQAAPAVGQHAPDFSLKDAAGRTVRLSDLRGRHVALEWTNPSCPYVDPQGRLIYAGGIDSIPSSDPADIRKAVNYVRQGLDEALAGKPLSAATTRPYGCSIKYKS